jgi:hypothetical protein
MLKLSSDHRRALNLLDGSANGATEYLMLALGFNQGLLAELILAGFASATVARTVAEFRRIKITEAGRRALAILK